MVSELLPEQSVTPDVAMLVKWESVAMDEDDEAARQQSLVDLEQLYEWLQQFEDPTIGKSSNLCIKRS